MNKYFLKFGTLFVSSLLASSDLDQLDQKNLSDPYVQVQQTETIQFSENYKGKSKEVRIVRDLTAPINENKIVALSMNGGGIRGILSSAILAGIEDSISLYQGNGDTSYIADYVDFIGGVSVGSIISALLSISKNNSEDEESVYSAADICNLLFENGPNMFKRNCLIYAPTIFSPTYTTDNLDKLITEILTEDNVAWLSDIKKVNLLIPAVDIAHDNTLVIFKNWKARVFSAYDYYLKDAVLGSSAAPVYFSSRYVENRVQSERIAVVPGQVEEKSHTLVDGGMCQNNPSQMLYTSMTKFYPGKDLYMLSIGTGKKDQSGDINYKKGKGGIVQWCPSIIGTFMGSDEENVDYALDDLLNKNYKQIRPVLEAASDSMDNTSVTNMNNLKMDAISYIDNNFDYIKDIAKDLILNRFPGKELKEFGKEDLIKRLTKELNLG